MNSQLKSRIMRRVYAIWFVRRIAPTLCGVGFFTYLAFYETAEKFFVAKVLGNFVSVASNVTSIPGFISAAIWHAQPQVLFIIGFSAIATLMLSIQLFRNIRTIVSQKQNIFEFNYRK